MAFFVVARDRDTGSLSLVSESTFASRQEAIDALTAALDAPGGALAEKEILIADADLAVPVVLLDRSVAQEAMEFPPEETASAFESPSETSGEEEAPAVDETYAAALLEEAMGDEQPAGTEQESDLGGVVEDHLAAAIKRATESLQSQGITPPEPIPAEGYTPDEGKQQPAPETQLSEPQEAGEEEFGPAPDQEQPSEQAPEEPVEISAAEATEEVVFPEGEIAVLDETRSTGEPEGLPGGGETAWPWAPEDGTGEPAATGGEGGDGGDAQGPEGGEPSGEPQGLAQASELIAEALEEIDDAEDETSDAQSDEAGDDFTPRPVIMGDYSGEPAADPEWDEVREPVGVAETDGGAAAVDAGQPDSGPAEQQADPGLEEDAFQDQPPREPAAYEPGTDIDSYTCNDCVYVNTCPKANQDTPAKCGSFQWRAT